MMTHLFLELKLDISWSQGRRLRISPCTLLAQLIDFSHSVGLSLLFGLQWYLHSRKYYGKKPPSEDLPVNEIINNMAAELDQRLLQTQGANTKPKSKNLNKTESRGLKWLENMIQQNKLAVVAADKGGAVLLVHPEA